MATYIYNGDGEKDFPTLGKTVKNGDTFDSADEIINADVTLASATKKTTLTSAVSTATTQGA
jgi:hypothetical protein